MPKIYLITFNSDLLLNKSLFHQNITNLFTKKYILDWWHYIDTTYIVASNLDVNTIYNAVFPGAPGRYILITEIDPNNAQGWLPQVAWTWLQKYQKK